MTANTIPGGTSAWANLTASVRWKPCSKSSRVSRRSRTRICRGRASSCGHTRAIPRDVKGVRRPFDAFSLTLLSGLLSGRKSLRAVEALSKELALGRGRHGNSDGALTHLHELMGEHEAPVLQHSVRDKGGRGQFRPPGAVQSWAAVDGKCMILQHGRKATWWRTSCWTQVCGPRLCF